MILNEGLALIMRYHRHSAKAPQGDHSSSQLEIFAVPEAGDLPTSDLEPPGLGAQLHIARTAVAVNDQVAAALLARR